MNKEVKMHDFSGQGKPCVMGNMQNMGSKCTILGVKETVCKGSFAKYGVKMGNNRGQGNGVGNFQNTGSKCI